MEPDQTDILAQNEKLTADLATAQQNLTQANAAIEQLRKDNTQLQGRVDEATKGNETLTKALQARTKERDDLKAENERLTARTADFNKAVAADVAKHGIRQTAATHQQQSDKPMTATEKCLAAKAK